MNKAESIALRLVLSILSFSIGIKTLLQRRPYRKQRLP